MGRRGISPVMSELMLLGIVVALGTMVYLFASASLGSFGGAFSALIGREGRAVAQQPVVEFVRFHGSTPGLRDRISVFVRNVGVEGLVVELVLVQNASRTGSNQPFFFSQASPGLSCQPATPIPCLVEPGGFTIVTLSLPSGLAWEPGVAYRVVVSTDQAVRVVEFAKP